MADNRYDPDKHDTYVTCPRGKRCGRKNAPLESDEFEPECYNCGTHLNIQPVELGETVELYIYDIHESGAGVGRTDDGFVILTHGCLPDAHVVAEITKIYQNHAEADVVEEHDLSDEDKETIQALKDGRDPEAEDEDEEDEEQGLGSRDNFFGEENDPRRRR